ncbi:protein MNN4-like [Cucumis melo var. makuwa]|uniref:Protein MNN4-like n=2 Tax=Cucumis melo TaxID=3656 RepID=A0A5A7SSF1_CUCMM|nr:protein MNN4-like [Cucumis melo var. makuwa]
MANKKTNTIKRFLTSKHTQSQEQIDKVRFTGSVLEQPQPSHNPLPDGSGGNFEDSIDLNRILAQGVGSVGQEQASSPITPTELERIARKAHEKKEKVTSSLLKVKVTTQGAKAFVQEKKEVKLREWDELFNKIDQVTLPAEKGKMRKTPSEKIYEEFKGTIRQEVRRKRKEERFS